MRVIPPVGRARPMARLALVTALASLVGVSVLGGCSTSLEINTNPPPTGPPVAKEQVAQVLREEIVRRTGQRPDSVNCPTDLPRVVGANVRCAVFQYGKKEETGSVTATFNDRGRMSYDFDVLMDPPSQTGPPPPSPGPGR